ncbi:MAG: hypothetical protein LKJ50_01010 [Clostridiales bacterium]|jgi:aspartate kinase|uniref:ACT domain-containing protein n=1 Tax=Caproicibacterium sp. BJN0003 TaxID=2994078 RepID=UPI00224F177F|nr:hypothetical protein [Caproicibacterium sp. BJN0003]MCI1951308.1 hypothetical protein [Clostridiales bacterium]MCI2161796.1 hypothetical protein [Oscillospiraceae bacterium]MCI1960484.1 hypothetical protein [Clostridiales bacterium]MCI2020971.1 hypothetical protein [Clostridiales bacterium]MCI2025354.1 hypothetical protein [Clostridiales bacterium]
MRENESISTISEITLVTLLNCPVDPDFIAKVFEKIADLGVNVDMISFSPNQGGSTAISFTIMDEDLGKILKFTSALREKAQIKPIISSNNCKINIYDENMVNTPGMAAKIFAAFSSINTDFRIVTTSDVDISVLVTEADYNDTLKAIQSAVQKN